MNKKTAEAYYFYRFLELSGVGFGDWQHQDRPDFLCTVTSGRIGAEVTRFSPAVQIGSPRPETQQSLRSHTMNLARREYYKLNGHPLHVRASFRNSHPLTKKRAPGLAMEIAEFLLASDRPLVHYHASGLERLIGPGSLPELQTLDAVRVSRESYGAWYPDRSAWVRHASESDIARIVSTKEPLVADYLHACEEVWLLIVFEFLAGDIHVAVPVEPPAFEIATKFARLYCLEPTKNVLVRIPCVGQE